MKRKLLATLLALCLIVGMIPVAASAEDGDVAQVGNNTYATLGEAVSNASSGETIKMIADTDISDTGLIVPEEKSLILDINGKKIEASNVPSKNIVVYGDLTIRDSAENSTGKIFTESTYASGGTTALVSAIGENASIILESGFIDAASFTDPANEGQYGLGVMNGGDITITGGKVEAGWYAISGNGNNKTQNSIIVIQGGELISTADYAVYLPHSGETTITGGTIYGAAGGISIQRGTLTVGGDALITSKGTGDTGDWGDGTGGQGCAALNIAGEYGDCAVQISGGTLTAEQDALIVRGNNENNKVLEITGGTFSSDVSEYISDEYTVVETENGFEVQKLGAENAVASVGTGENVNYYKTVAEAVENANNGTVTLLQNATFDTLPLSSGSVIVDLNGYTLTSVSGETSVIQKGANLTIQDSKGTGTLVYNGITDPAKAAFEVQVGSSISLKGIRYETSGTGVYAWGNATTVNIEDVDIDSSGYCVGTNAGETENYRVNINITNSQLTSALEGAGTAVLFNVPGTLNIDDSTLNGHWQGLIARGGNITISNSVITNTYDTLNTNYEQAWGSGNAVTLAGITIGNKGNNAYDYPVSIKLENTSVTSVGPNPAIYVYQMTGVNRKVTVAISGDSAVSGDFIVEKDEGVESVDVAISGGYFTSDPSEYVSEGYIAGDSDNSSYTYQVVEKTNSETPAEVVPAAPAVDTGDLSPEEATAVSTALANAEAELTAAANTQADQNTVTNDEAKNALADASINTSGEGVTVVIQPYLDITVKDYNIAETTKVLSLDITPMYRTVATIVDVENNPENIKVKGDAGVMGDANAVVIPNQGGILPVKGAVEISIPLPSGFVSDTENIYVQHKDIYEYTATVTVAAKVYTATFTNPHGFSEFTFTTDSQAVATIGSTSYTSLQAAVDDATSDDIIVVKNGNVDLSATANKTVTIQNGTGSGITVSVNGVSKTIGQNKIETFVYTSGGGGAPTEPEEPTWPFEDVTEGDDWFYDAVAYVYENGIMAGTGETTFEPTMELDRAMAAQLFYNLEGKPAVTGDSAFTDVTSGHWAVDAITWAAQNDIVAGIGGNLYDPDSNVTREQFAVMLYKYARFKGYDLTAAGDLTQFPDAGSISSWAETALSWANGNGLINGHENGTIDPKGSTIRAQAASIMANFDQNVAK